MFVSTGVQRRPPGGFIQPCLPTASDRPRTGPEWVHEIKHDGYRLFAQRQGIGGRLLTRNGYDWSERYPAVLKALMALMVRSCLIDGEVVICDERGVAMFDRLRHGPRAKPDAVLFAFDLLELDGEDLRAMPIERRKRKPEGLLDGAPTGLQLCEHLQGDGVEIFRHACALGCEGTVSKRLGSRYSSGYMWPPRPGPLPERPTERPYTGPSA
jgi:bifunctional non-homologous end joining protein LigD